MDAGVDKVAFKFPHPSPLPEGEGTLCHFINAGLYKSQALIDTGEFTMKNIAKLIAFSLCATLLSGCVLTKVASVPMRLGGAVVSIVPGVGNTAHDAIDEAAEKVDDLPL